MDAALGLFPSTSMACTKGLSSWASGVLLFRAWEAGGVGESRDDEGLSKGMSGSDRSGGAGLELRAELGANRRL